MLNMRSLRHIVLIIPFIAVKKLVHDRTIFAENSTSDPLRPTDKMALEASEAVAKFSAKFINELNKEKNVVSSPLSVEFVLGLLTLGCSDPGHKELLSVLGIKNDEVIRSTFSTMGAKVRSVKGVTLNIANKVYLMEGPTELNTELEKDAVEVFDAAFEKVDFAKAKAATDRINSWVESKTNNKIKDLLSPDSVDDSTQVVLVNAIYFKGTWQQKFNAANTEEKPFNVNENTTINVPMMYIEHKFRYGESDSLNAQLLELMYEGNETSLVVVLPKDIEGLNDVLKKLAGGHSLIGDLNKMHPTKVQVSLPKFKIETEIDVKDLLLKLGVVNIFDSLHSSLIKILKGGERLFVSKAVQKAFIEVNEEGAEAAAATGAVMMLRCAMREPPSVIFKADRPFLYLLTDHNRNILFIGAFRGK